MDNMKNTDKSIAAILSELEALGIKNATETSVVKFLYLMDYANACATGGQKFTNINWKFESFGPFDASIRSELATMLSRAVVSKAPVVMPDREFSAISLSKDQARLTFEQIGLSDSIAVQVRGYLKEFGRNLTKLLNFVYYKTEPMAEVQPNQVLDFTGCADKNSFSSQSLPKPDLTEFHAKMAALKAKRKPSRAIKWAGLYDETYERAVAVMNADEGFEVILEGSAILAI